jgi:ribonuclease HI
MNGGEERSLRVSPNAQSDGLRGSAALDTRPYDNWQWHWDKVKHPGRDVLADDYAFNAILDGVEGIMGTEVDPRKDFRDQDWDERAPTRNSKKFPLLALPELSDYPREFRAGSEVQEEASSFRFGSRVVFAEEPDYNIKKMLACCPPQGHVHVYTDGSGMDMEVEGTKVKRFGAGVYSHGFARNAGEDADTSPSYHMRGIFTWENGKQTVANGELFGICEALNTECEEGETDLFLFTDSMVTIHLIRKGIMRPWLLMGHEHEDTIKEFLRKISRRGR